MKTYKPATWHREAMRRLEQEGVEAVKFLRRRRGHPYLEGRYKGQYVRVTVGATPSDRRAMLNVIADARRSMKNIDASTSALQ